MHRFFRALLRHRLLALGALLAVTVALGRYLVDPSRLLVDFSLEALLVPDAAARADLDALHRDFGDDVGVVGVVVALPPAGPGTVFDAPVLATIEGFADWLAAQPEIDGERVVSLGDLPDLRGDEIVPEALTRALADGADTARRGQALLAHRSFVGSLVSADARATIVVAPFLHHTSDLRKPLFERLERERAGLERALGPGAEVHVVGVPLVQATYAEVVLRDIILLVPITIVVIAILLGLTFRRVYAVVGPLAGVGLATIWTLGLIQALGLPFDMVNSVTGVVILVVGVAEGAHIVARHREECLRLGPTGTREAAILATMDRMAPACFVTSATTAVGFGSLAAATLPAIVSFGLVLAAGVMMAWAIQMVLMPIVLSFVPTHDVLAGRGATPAAVGIDPLGDGRFARWLDRQAARVIARPHRYAIIGLASGVIALVGALNVEADARAAGELQADHPVARGLAMMEARLSGVLVHAVAISGRDGGTCTSDAECAPRGPRSQPLCKRVDLAFRASAHLQGAVADLTGVAGDPLFFELEQALTADDLPPHGVCSESVATPDVIGFIADLEAFIAAQRASATAGGEPVLIASTASLVDLLIDLGRGASPPRDPGVIAERIGLLESGAPELTGRYLTPDHTRTQLVLRANDIGLKAWRDFEPILEREISRLVAHHDLEGRVSVVLSGGATLAEKAISGIGTSLVDSVLYDFLLILAFIVGLVRSFRLGLLAMIPNLWPLLITLGMMGFLEIPVRASTIIVFSVALGIAVDDTTHFVHRYREEVARLGEGEAAIRRTVLATGRPIVLTSMILVCGFLVNALSDFKAIVEFGVLSAITMGLALLAELYLTPALLLLLKGRLSLPAAPGDGNDRS